MSLEAKALISYQSVPPEVIRIASFQASSLSLGILMPSRDSETMTSSFPRVSRVSSSRLLYFDVPLFDDA